MEGDAGRRRAASRRAFTGRGRARHHRRHPHGRPLVHHRGLTPSPRSRGPAQGPARRDWRNRALKSSRSNRRLASVRCSARWTGRSADSLTGSTVRDPGQAHLRPQGKPRTTAGTPRFARHSCVGELWGYGQRAGRLGDLKGGPTYAASGTARARLTACARRASITRSA